MDLNQCSKSWDLSILPYVFGLLFYLGDPWHFSVKDILPSIPPPPPHLSNLLDFISSYYLIPFVIPFPPLHFSPNAVSFNTYSTIFYFLLLL